jgi:hypothetical protein
MNEFEQMRKDLWSALRTAPTGPLERRLGLASVRVEGSIERRGYHTVLVLTAYDSNGKNACSICLYFRSTEATRYRPGPTLVPFAQSCGANEKLFIAMSVDGYQHYRRPFHENLGFRLLAIAAAISAKRGCLLVHGRAFEEGPDLNRGLNLAFKRLTQWIPPIEWHAQIPAVVTEHDPKRKGPIVFAVWGEPLAQILSFPTSDLQLPTPSDEEG